METIEEEAETETEAENFIELENNLFEEIIHSINEIDNQLLSLLVQREMNYTLFKDMCSKYNKPNSKHNLIKSTHNRINNNYPKNKHNLNQIFNTINKFHN